MTGRRYNNTHARTHDNRHRHICTDRQRDIEVETSWTKMRYSSPSVCPSVCCRLWQRNWLWPRSDERRSYKDCMIGGARQTDRRTDELTDWTHCTSCCHRMRQCLAHTRTSTHFKHWGSCPFLPLPLHFPSPFYSPPLSYSLPLLSS